MRVIVFVASALAFCTTISGQTSPPRDRLTGTEKQEVRNVYFGKRPAPDFLARLDRLRSTSPDERRDAARWLLGLVDLTIADEGDRTASWHRLRPGQEEPKYPEVSEAPPATFLDWILAALRTKDYGEAAVPAIRHVVLSGPDFLRREAAMDVARRWKGAGTDAVILELIRRPSLPPWLRQPALQEAGKRKLAVGPAVLTFLAHDLDGMVRKAARWVITELKYPEPTPFDYTAAARSAEFRALAAAAGGFIPFRPPPDARFVCVTLTLEDREWQRPTREFRGWHLTETHDSVSLFTPNGEWTTISKKLGTVTVRTVPGRTEAERIIRFGVNSIESSIDRPQDLGLMHEQDDTWSVSAYEIIFADWLLRRGDEALAARVLLPAISFVRSSYRRLPDAARNVMGEALASQIIGRFVIERDDATVGRAARAAIRTQPETATGQLAARMLAELPRRTDDFRGLRLPTPARWKALRTSLSREEQIRFLLKRFRLNNAYIEGRMLFGDKFDEDQFSGPTTYMWFCLSKTERSAESLFINDHEGHEVINPYRELLGKWDYENGGRVSGMSLSFADLPVLLPFLADRWFTRVGGSFPEWWIDDTFVPLTEVVNNVAGVPLIDVGFGKLDDAARGEEILALVKWACEYRHRSERDRLLWALKRGVERRYPWSDYSGNLLRRLVELKHVPAIPDILRIAETNPMHGPSVELALDTAMELNRDVTLKAIRPWIKNKSPVLKLFAGYALIEAGEFVTGRRAVADGLRFGQRNRLEGARYERAVEPLLREGSPESIAVARLVFDADELVAAEPDSCDREAVLKAFAEAGLPDAHRYYLRKLRPPPVRNGVQKYMSGLPVRGIRTPFGLKIREKQIEVFGRSLKVLSAGAPKTSAEAWLEQEIAKREAIEAARGAKDQ